MLGWREAFPLYHLPLSLWHTRVLALQASQGRPEGHFQVSREQVLRLDKDRGELCVSRGRLGSTSTFHQGLLARTLVKALSSFFGLSHSLPLRGVVPINVCLQAFWSCPQSLSLAPFSASRSSLPLERQRDLER